MIVLISSNKFFPNRKIFFWLPCHFELRFFSTDSLQKLRRIIDQSEYETSRWREKDDRCNQVYGKVVFINSSKRQSRSWKIERLHFFQDEEYCQWEKTHSLERLKWAEAIRRMYWSHQRYCLCDLRRCIKYSVPLKKQNCQTDVSCKCISFLFSFLAVIGSLGEDLVTVLQCVLFTTVASCCIQFRDVSTFYKTCHKLWSSANLNSTYLVELNKNFRLLVSDVKWCLANIKLLQNYL